jgi:hypothetical protein
MRHAGVWMVLKQIATASEAAQAGLQIGVQCVKRPE